MAAGAGVVQGGASFTYQRGPDGQMFAVGGEVKIDTSAESDPDQTIGKIFDYMGIPHDLFQRWEGDDHRAGCRNARDLFCRRFQRYSHHV